MKPPASNWLLAPMPVPLNSHSAPMAGWFHTSAGQRYRLLAGVLQVHLQVVLQVLADARQVVHVDVEAFQQVGGPTPERCRICGEAMAPPHSSTSRRAVRAAAGRCAATARPPRLPSNRMRSVSAWVTMVRFGRGPGPGSRGRCWSDGPSVTVRSIGPKPSCW
jgi:hypothetical protein